MANKQASMITKQGTSNQLYTHKEVTPDNIYITAHTAAPRYQHKQYTHVNVPFVHPPSKLLPIGLTAKLLLILQ